MSRVREWCARQCSCVRKHRDHSDVRTDTCKPVSLHNTILSDGDNDNELTRLSSQSPTSMSEATNLASITVSPECSMRDSMLREQSDSTLKRQTMRSSKPPGTDPNTQKRISDAIDRELSRHKSTIRNRSIVLLLGTGESGKSTFLKQLRILHDKLFTEDELQSYRATILNNAFFGAATLLTAAEIFGFTLATENLAHAERVKQRAGELQVARETCSAAVFAEFICSLEALWNDPAMQSAYAQRSEFHLGENVRYFLRHVRRIGASDYVPTDEDVLYARKPTKGVIELALEINRRPFVFVDVGGQRVERAKWCRMFNEALTCILFLVASSEFDQVLVEDASVNRLSEAANVFETIVNNRSFASVSLVMFFNKSDVLEEKVTLGVTCHLAEFFPEFSGDPRVLSDVQQFIVALFQQRIRQVNRQFYKHFTTAVDTNNIKLVFRSVKDILLEKNIESIMLQ